MVSGLSIQRFQIDLLLSRMLQLLSGSLSSNTSTVKVNKVRYSLLLSVAEGEP